MEYATFRKWLAEHGCRFDTQSEKRGEGHGTVTIHRAGRTAELPLVGASHNLDPRSVRQVCEALGLDWSKLPGPEGRGGDKKPRATSPGFRYQDRLRSAVTVEVHKFRGRRRAGHNQQRPRPFEVARLRHRNALRAKQPILATK
jgi:hypothetical protein